MNCIEFETALELAVEQRQPPDPAILEHARSCSDCQTIWDLRQRLDSAIASWRIHEAPAGLVDSVLQELADPVLAGDFDDPPILSDFESVFRSDLPAAPRSALANNTRFVVKKKSQSNGLAIAAMSACLLFATALVFQASRPRPFELAQHQKKDGSIDLPGTLTAVLSDLNSEYRGMAAETTSAAQEMVRAIPHPETAAVLPETENFQLKQAPDEMVRIWKPIGNQVGSALGFLWKALPSDIPSG